MTRPGFLAIALLLGTAIGAGAAGAQYRDHPPPPPSYNGPPLPPPNPPQAIDPTPPPLSPAMRAIYAPFYAAGIVLHYGWYYAVEAPIEVFSRALDYGVDAGVDEH